MFQFSPCSLQKGSPIKWKPSALIQKVLISHWEPSNKYSSRDTEFLIKKCLPWIYSIFYFLPAFLVAQEKLGQSQKETSLIWLTFSPVRYNMYDCTIVVRTVHTVHICPLLLKMKNSYFFFIFYFSAINVPRFLFCSILCPHPSFL